MLKQITLSLALTSAAFAAPGEIRNLGNISGTRDSRGNAINDAGDVVGEAQGVTVGNPNSRAIFWPANGGGLQNLGTFSGANSSKANGVNNSGATVGWADGTSSPPAETSFERAFVRQPDSSMTNIGVNSGTYSRAQGINNNGDVVGRNGYAAVSGSSMIDERGFLRRASDGAIITLPRPAGSISYPALAVNDSRVVVGSSFTSSNDEQAYLWRESTGQLVMLGTLGGRTSTANSINAQGDIVGTSKNAGGALQAFIRASTDGVMKALSQPPGTILSDAYDINDAGVTVGAYGNASGAFALMWLADGTRIDLDAWLDYVNPTAGANWTIFEARSINAAGLIAGTGTYNDGPGGLTDGTRAFVLDASVVPEPTAAAILLPLAIALGRHRK